MNLTLKYFFLSKHFILGGHLRFE